MQTSHRSPFLTIHTEGALLPVDLLQRVLAGDKGLDGLTPESYHLPPGEKLNEAINRAWNHLQGAWATFETSRGRLNKGDPGTTLTRERWLLPLFQELGYGRLQTAKAIEIEGKSYPVSHTWGMAEAPLPIHLVGCGVELDKRQAGVSGASKAGPHSLLQELLNRDETRQWGLVSNGLHLRVLRDNAALTRQAYLEFDLEAMFSGEVYADFAVLWLVCHQSRLEGDKPEAQWLERWSQVAQDQGTRALEGLRSGVEEAIIALGQGFLVHPANGALRQKLKSGELSRQGYFRQLLRLVYRLIFLFVAEDRDLLLLPEAGPAERERYLKFYSTARLRRLAERQRGGRHPDLWLGFNLLTDLLAGNIPGGRDIGLPVLGGFLFSHAALPDLEDAQVDNQALLNALRSLAYTQEKHARRAVDYKNLGSEELGSVYESLLELQPLLNVAAGTFQLTTVAGNERKTSGSYYTAGSLIKITLDSALDPVILQAILKAGISIEMQIAALLALKICDPACGSGHFLIAAARRLARRIAQLRSGDEEPSPAMVRHALREVIAHCIYGVDLNPMAVELCKVNLWLEALEPGKPLTFLDAHIKCGNSLVGVGPQSAPHDLVIPDEAFDPVTGDDKKVAAALKKRNKQERQGQLTFDLHGVQEEPADDYAARARQVEAMPEDTPEQVAAKEAAYTALQSEYQSQQRRLLADLWTAAFFWRLQPDPGGALAAPTQGELRNARLGKPSLGLAAEARRLAEENRFFHWPLEFPDIFEQGGFNCVLGNPPWERIKLQEEEFFAGRDPEIAAAPNKAARQKLINTLSNTNPELLHAFTNARHSAEAASKFARTSGCFKLTAVGDVNTYALFAEHFRDLIADFGWAGVLLPTGISTDDTTKHFFERVVENQSLALLVGFENEAFIFPSVHHSFRFCLFVITGSQVKIPKARYAYFCRYIHDLKQDQRFFDLSPKDISLFNPNTHTSPIFRTTIDANLAKSIYQRVPVLANEPDEVNLWKISFCRLIDMANDSDMFVDAADIGAGHTKLYEAKLAHQYDHRWATYQGVSQEDLRKGLARVVTINEKTDPAFQVLPRYWVPLTDVNLRLARMNDGDKYVYRNLNSAEDKQAFVSSRMPKWLIGFRDVCRAHDERTTIFSILPSTGVGHKMPLVLLDDSLFAWQKVCFTANFNSLTLDYLVRQKLGGASLSYFIIKQVPILPPGSYTFTDFLYITTRVLELVYTAWDLQPFANDLWRDAPPDLQQAFVRQWEECASIETTKDTKTTKEAREPSDQENFVSFVSSSRFNPTPGGFPHPPFRWNEAHRAVLRAELDAYYARLYGLTRDELRYILDPQDVYGPDFPGETFRVLKEKEIKQFGEYRTRRLALEAWDRLEGVEVGSSAGQAAGRQAVQPVMITAKEIRESKPVAAPPEPARPAAKARVEEESPAQPAFIDFGLYKCEGCGKLVMGFEKENHGREKHGGQVLEWKQVI